MLWWLLLLLLPPPRLAGLAAEDVVLDVEYVDEVNSNGSEPEVGVGVVRKCCPPGLSMFRVSGAASCGDQVTCKIPDADPATHLWSLVPGGGHYGFPTACPHRPGGPGDPDADDPNNCTLVLLDAEGRRGPEPFCVDKLILTDHEGMLLSQEQAPLAGVACKRTEGLPRLRVASAAAGPRVPFRKCCPVQHVYDLALRVCRPPGQQDDEEVDATPPPVDYRRDAVFSLLAKVFDKNLTALVELRVGSPKCGDSEAAMDVAVFDLPWDEHLVDQQGGTVLRIGGALVPLGPDEFCADDTRDLEGSLSDQVPSSALVVKACVPRAEEACRRFGCFRKCCPHGEYFAPAGHTHNCVSRPPRTPPLLPQVHVPPASNLSDVQGYVPKRPVELVAGAYRRYLSDQEPHKVLFTTAIHNICPNFRFRLQEEEDVWFFDRLGRLYQPLYPAELRTTEYCVEDSQELKNVSVFLCLADTDPTQVEENSRILLIAVGLLISCMFLAATLATYCCLPALQNLHGKTLMCHVASLLAAYLCLALTQMLTKPVFLQNEWICSIIGNCLLFTFLSAFSWLNVMCFDIWRTFGALRSSRSVRRSSASRRFRLYCLYAWGVSSFITALCITVDRWPGNDRSVFRPQIGDGSCWFRTDGKAYGILIFFVGPLLVQTCSNLLLFLLTVRNYSRIKSEINRLHNPPNSRKVKKFQADSNKLKMNLKLFVVMGVTWVLELVSTFFPKEHAVFYLSDAANVLQGVMIFAIFVLKRKVMRALAVRLGRSPPPAPKSNSPSIQTDCRLHVALGARGKTVSNSTLFTSDFQGSAVTSRAAETSQ